MPTPSTGHVVWFGRQVETDQRIPQPPEDLPFEDMVLARGGARRRPPKPSGARVTAVDNFQGEESRVVLLSLVRSNQQGRIGYLKEPNRVCVALRKEGLFVIGNCTMLSKKSPLCWKPILKGAKQSGSLGGALPLYCRRHDHVTPVSCDSDIEKLCPNGGCSQICDFRRTCGHTCQEVCHDLKFIHDQPCTKPCVSRCPSGHRCCSRCGLRPCPPFTAKCEKECAAGHACVKTCGERCACDQRCEKKLSCGHRCQSKCGVSCTSLCQELVMAMSCAFGQIRDHGNERTVTSFITASKPQRQHE